MPAPTEPMELFVRFGVALALGLMIGLERGWSSQQDPDASHVGGLRTFGLMAVLGGLWGLLSQHFESAALLGFGFLALAGLLVTTHVLEVRETHDLGMTTTVAALVTFALGALAVLGELVIASAVAVVTTVLLGLKPTLHGLVEGIERRELHAAFKLLLISVVMLPVLPDHGFGPPPWDALNPTAIWWLVVLIAAISFAGYLAVKLAGPRLGVALTSIFGGLASSTAVTLSFARLGRSSPAMEKLLAAGIVVASGIMFPRVLVEVGVVEPGLVRGLALPLGVMFAISIVPGVALLRNGLRQGEKGELALKNPFELGAALKFGALIALIMLLANVLHGELGDRGVYILAAISGLSDVDAISLSLAKMAGGEIEPEVARRGIVLAVLVNTATKGVLALMVGGLRMGARVLFALLVAIGGGIAVLVFV